MAEETSSSALLGVPEGRHNVAHHGSGGEAFDDDQKTPAGVTQGTQRCQITLNNQLVIFDSLREIYAFNLGKSRSAFPRLTAFQSLSENPGYTSRPGSVKS
jgi:hypothetical protein